MISAITAGLLSLSLTIGQIQETPDRLVSSHGIEFVNDGRVFLLFAGLNGLGYSKETLRQGPPLEAPVFHPLRQFTRNAIRPLVTKGDLKALKKLFDEQGRSIDNYLKLVLAYDRSLSSSSADAAGEELKAIASTAQALQKLGGNKALTKLFDDLSAKQRSHAKDLMAQLEKDFVAMKKYLGSEDLRAPLTLTVIPNPLDAHNVVRNIKVGEQHFVVVGPGKNAARVEILRQSVRPVVADLVEKNWPKARRLAQSWRGLKVSKRITERFADGQAYLIDTLTRALVYKAGIHSSDKNTGDDEDFIDKESSQGFRWARACIKALAKRKPSADIASDFPKFIKTISP